MIWNFLRKFSLKNTPKKLLKFFLPQCIIVLKLKNIFENYRETIYPPSPINEYKYVNPIYYDINYKTNKDILSHI